MPELGDAGRCAVVPTGRSNAPVLVLLLSLIDAGVTLSSDDALMSPPASTITCDKFRALLISIPYAVNVPDEVKVWIV
jgi:hypothetical protein